MENSYRGLCPASLVGERPVTRTITISGISTGPSGVVNGTPNSSKGNPSDLDSLHQQLNKQLMLRWLKWLRRPSDEVTGSTSESPMT